MAADTENSPMAKTAAETASKTTKEKAALRQKLRRTRKAYLAALPSEARALMFHRPPRPVSERIADKAVIGLYHNTGAEAPTSGYARFFAEQGHALALPFFAAREAMMEFRRWRDPFAESDLAPGPYGALQPLAEAKPLTPDIIFVPLLGFTENGERIGQGGGHYDRWLAAHQEQEAIGLAWDCQRLDSLPTEAHDARLSAVITPSCLYEFTA